MSFPTLHSYVIPSRLSTPNISWKYVGLVAKHPRERPLKCRIFGSALLHFEENIYYGDDLHTSAMTEAHSVKEWGFPIVPGPTSGQLDSHLHPSIHPRNEDTKAVRHLEENNYDRDDLHSITTKSINLFNAYELLKSSPLFTVLFLLATRSLCFWFLV